MDIIYGITIAFIFFLIGKTLNPRRAIERLDINDEGEKKVILEIIENISKKENYLTNNITFQTGDKKSTQIDHILINKYGIFVIETKNYSGHIFGNNENFQWTQTFGNNEKYRFYNPLKQNDGHINYLKKIIKDIPKENFLSIIVFTGNAIVHYKEGSNVIYLKGLINYLKEFKEEKLTTDEIYSTIGSIEFNRKKRSRQTEDDHIKYIKEITTKRQQQSHL